MDGTPTRDRFSSRLGLILAALGMAIGAGNIWRFPRIMGKFDGGGTFLIPWAVFLFTWSIPLLVIETAIGRKTRRGVLGSMAEMMGRRAWIGAFVALCTIGIMAYYAVVAGWCGTYVVASLDGGVLRLDHDAAVGRFEELGQGPIALGATVLAFLAAAFFVQRGLGRGVELANRIFLPLLFALLALLAAAGLSREGAGAGLTWMLKVDGGELFGSAKPWLEALSQSAWSTGAGWGLLLVLSVGARRREGLVGDAVVTGVGNNLASLLAALATIPAVFALAPLVAPGQSAIDVIRDNGPGNTGMAMVWLPRIFGGFGAAGRWLSAAFFTALSFAALTSLIAMVELGTRTFMDLGLPRTRALAACLLLGFVWGAPSALDLGFLGNQDWVWGLGLILSGAIFALAVACVGFERFRTEWLTAGGRPALGRWFLLFPALLIPLQFLALILWWFWQAGSWSTSPWNPLEPYSIGTCLAQWALAFTLLRLLVPRAPIPPLHRG